MDHFMVWGQTSSQAEAAVGRRPDQFRPCYGALYIFILRSLSVRLFHSFCMTFLLFSPSPLPSQSCPFSVSLRNVSALCSHSPFCSFISFSLLQYFDLSLLLFSHCLVSFQQLNFWILSFLLIFRLLPITHQMTWCCLHVLFVISSLFNLLWPSQS